MSRRSLIITVVVIVVVALGVFVWSPPGQSLVGKYYGGGTTVVKTP